MHNMIIIDTGESINFPSEIDDLTPKQWIRFNELVSQSQQGIITTDNMFAEMVFSALNIPRRQILKVKHKPSKFRNIIYTNVYRIAEVLHSFFETEEINGRKYLIPKTSTTKNLLPEICLSVFKRKLYGPADALTDIAFCEYDEANNYYREYLQTQSTEALNNLVAVLYRPRRLFLWLIKKLPWYNGEARVKYNKNLVDQRAKIINSLPLHVKLAVFHFFHSCEKFLHEGELNINGNLIKLSVLYESEPDAPKPEGNIGLTGLLFELAESGVFGNAQETSMQNMFDIMARLYQIRVGAKAIKEYYRHKTPNT
jgi:hypothetical protein